MPANIDIGSDAASEKWHFYLGCFQLIMKRKQDSRRTDFWQRVGCLPGVYVRMYLTGGGGGLCTDTNCCASVVSPTCAGR